MAWGSMRCVSVWLRCAIYPALACAFHHGSDSDPQFEQKAADIIGLYLKPPAHAALFCVDEKTAIQALDRKDPVLPLSPGRAERLDDGRTKLCYRPRQNQERSAHQYKVRFVPTIRSSRANLTSGGTDHAKTLLQCEKPAVDLG